MAVVATVIALLGPPARAATDGKPCRTPCLSVSVPREAPEKPAEAEAKPATAARPNAKPRPQATASAAPAPHLYEAQREPVAKRPAPSRRCTDINMRAAVGEPLSDEDMKTLRSQC
jgi:hypothetical protein